MAWLLATEFKAIYVTDSATEISSEQIEQCLDEAIDELAALCGDTAAEAVKSATDNTLINVKRFRRAQGKLAYRELLLIMSSRFRSGGIMSQEKDLNAGAQDTYEKFSEVEKRRAALYSEALRIIGSYLTQATEGAGDGAGGGSIEFSHPEDSDCCYPQNFRIPVC